MANNVLIDQPTGANAILATVEAAGVHTLAVSAGPANADLLMTQGPGAWGKISAALSSGVNAVVLSYNAPNASIAYLQDNGQWALLGVEVTGGRTLLCASLSAPTNSINVGQDNGQRARIGTVTDGSGRHSICTTPGAANSSLVFGQANGQSAIFNTQLSGGVHILCTTGDGSSAIVSPGVLGGMVTFSRASAATYFDSTGALQIAGVDVPRYNQQYGDTTGRLMIEEARTNLTPYSNALTAVGWNDGGLTPSVAGAGFTLTEANTTAEHELFNGGIATTNAVVYTVYADMKAGTRTQAYLSFAIAGGRLGAFFNLDTGTLGTADGGVTASIVSLGNGVYRCIITLTAASTATRYISIFSAAGNSRSTNGNGTITAYRVQCEAAAFPTSFIITGAAADTRAADVCNINTLGAWYTQGTGSMYAKIRMPQGVAVTPQGVFGFNDGSNNNRITARNGSAAVMNELIVSGGATVINQATANSFTIGATAKIGVSWDGTGGSVVMNGGAVVSAAGAAPIGLTGAWIGNAAAALAQPLNGEIEQLTYFPTKLSNAALQALTA